MKILLLCLCLAAAALILAFLRRIFSPPRFEMDEPEFDLRAAKLPDDIAKSAARYALVKTIAKQRYTLKPVKRIRDKFHFK